MIKNTEKYETRAIRLKKTEIDKLNQMAKKDRRTFVSFMGKMVEKFLEENWNEIDKSENN